MKKNIKKAFTLLELAIVLTIVAILAIPAVDFLILSSKSTKIQDTRNKSNFVTEAISSYYKSYGKLPLPARIDLSSEDEEYTKSGDDNEIKISSGKYYYGSLPTEELGISDKYMFDKWGNKFSYYVTKNATKDETAINKHNENTLYAKDNDIGTKASSGHIFAIISHGESGEGAYNAKGEQKKISSSIEISNIFNSSDIGTESNPLILSDGSNGEIATSSKRNDVLANLFGRTASGRVYAGNQNVTIGGSLVSDSNSTLKIDLDGDSKLSNVEIEGEANINNLVVKRTDIPFVENNASNGIVASFERVGEGDVGLSFSQDSINSFAIIHNSGKGTASDNQAGGLNFYGGRDRNTAGALLMRLSDNGNLGIGNDNPTERLHVSGDARVTDDMIVSGNVGIGDDAPTEALTIIGNIRITGSYLGSSGDPITTSATLPSNASIEKVTRLGSALNNGILLGLVRDGDENGGEVGISFVQRNIVPVVNEETNSFAIIHNAGKGSASDHQAGGLDFYQGRSDSNVGTLLMRLSDLGRLGIGTDNPSETLDVRGTNEQNILISGGEDNNAGVKLLEKVTSGSEDGAIIRYNGANDRLDVNSIISGTEQINLTVLNSGNVGVGTVIPDSKLHIMGDIKVTGDYLDASGNLAIATLPEDGIFGTGLTIGSTPNNTRITGGNIITSGDITSTAGNIIASAIQTSSLTTDSTILGRVAIGTSNYPSDVVTAFLENISRKLYIDGSIQISGHYLDRNGNPITEASTLPANLIGEDLKIFTNLTATNDGVVASFTNTNTSDKDIGISLRQGTSSSFAIIHDHLGGLSFYKGNGTNIQKGSDGTRVMSLSNIGDLSINGSLTTTDINHSGDLDIINVVNAIDNGSNSSAIVFKAKYDTDISTNIAQSNIDSKVGTISYSPKDERFTVDKALDLGLNNITSGNIKSSSTAGNQLIVENLTTSVAETISDNRSSINFMSTGSDGAIQKDGSGIIEYSSKDEKFIINKKLDLGLNNITSGNIRSSSTAGNQLIVENLTTSVAGTISDNRSSINFMSTGSDGAIQKDGSGIIEYSSKDEKFIINKALDLGANNVITTGETLTGAITGTSLNTGSGAITTTGAVSFGAITGTSLDGGTGGLTTSGDIVTTGTTGELTIGGTGSSTIAGSVGVGTSDNYADFRTNASITGTTPSDTKLYVAGDMQISGKYYDLGGNEVGAIDFTSLTTNISTTGNIATTGTGTITSAGAITGTSLDGGAGGLTTSGDIVTTGTTGELTIGGTGSSTIAGSVGVGTSDNYADFRTNASITGTTPSDTKLYVVGDMQISGKYYDLGGNEVGAIDFTSLTTNISTTGNIATTGTGTITSAGAITGTSLDGGSGAITTTGAVSFGAITGTSLNTGSGAITTSGNIATTGTGTITSAGAITGTSLDGGTGGLTTSGDIVTTGTTGELTIGGTGSSTIAGSVGVGTSDNYADFRTNASITGITPSDTKLYVAGDMQISGKYYDLGGNEVGAIDFTSLTTNISTTGNIATTGTGTITSAGAITGTSLDGGTGGLTTSGNIATTGTGTITSAGAITGTSLDGGTGGLTTSGDIVTTGTTGELTIGGTGSSTIAGSVGVGTSDNYADFRTNASITGTTPSDTKLYVAGDMQISGKYYDLGGNEVGAIDFTSLTTNISTTGNIATTGTGTITSAGAITGTSLDGGTGGLTTSGNIATTGTGTITSAGAITGTSLDGGSGAITTTGAVSFGAITGTSLDAGSGLITTSGNLQTTGGILDVDGTGNSTIAGDLRIGSSSSVPATIISVTNSLDTTANPAKLFIDGNMQISGKYYDQDGVEVGASANLAADETITTSLTVGTDSKLTGTTLGIGKTVGAGIELDVEGDIAGSGDLRVTGDSKIGGKLTASGANLDFFTNDTATERMRIDTSGNVGIGTGTNALTDRLEVDGNIKVDAIKIKNYEIDSPVNNLLRFKHNNENVMVVNNNIVSRHSVTISNNNEPTNNTDNYKVTMAMSAKFTTDNGLTSTTRTGYIEYSGLNNNFTLMNNTNVTGDFEASGDLSVTGDSKIGGKLTASGANLDFFTNDTATERMRIDTSGNVGIGTGTNALTDRLEVSGNTSITGTTGDQLSLENTTDSALVNINFEGKDASSVTQTGIITYDPVGNDFSINRALDLGANNIVTTGTAGFGAITGTSLDAGSGLITTSGNLQTTGGILDVDGTGNSTIAGDLRIGSSSSVPATIISVTNSVDTTANPPKLFIDGNMQISGKYYDQDGVEVGASANLAADETITTSLTVGTDSKLTGTTLGIGKTVGAGIELDVEGDIAGSGDLSVTGDSKIGGKLTASGANLDFFTNDTATERMRIDTSGNVGIGTGTNALTDRLEVSGNTSITGTTGDQLSLENITDSALVNINFEGKDASSVTQTGIITYDPVGNDFSINRSLDLGANNIVTTGTAGFGAITATSLQTTGTATIGGSTSIAGDLAITGSLNNSSGIRMLVNNTRLRVVGDNIGNDGIAGEARIELGDGSVYLQIKDDVANQRETLLSYQGDLSIYSTGFLNRMTLLNDGNVGIGTANPGEKLEVNGNIKATGNMKFSGDLATGGRDIIANEAHIGGDLRIRGENGYDANGESARIGFGDAFQTYISTIYDGDFSFTHFGGDIKFYSKDKVEVFGDLEATGSVTGGSAYVNSSDKRIKDIKGISDSKQDLSIIKKLEITDYLRKDKIQYGDKKEKMLIAQQLEKHYPQAVFTRKNIIPDIYKKAKSFKLLVNNKVEITGVKSYGLKKGEKVKILIGKLKKNQKSVKEEITSVSGKKFVIKLSDSNYKKIEKAKSLFIYGREVKDFKSIAYSEVAMLNVSATQELAKRQENMASKQDNMASKQEKIIEKLSKITGEDIVLEEKDFNEDVNKKIDNKDSIIIKQLFALNAILMIIIFTLFIMLFRRRYKK